VLRPRRSAWLGHVLQCGFAEQNRLQTRVIAVQQEFHFRVTHVSERHAIDDGLGRVVAAHRVDRYDDLAVHAGLIL
jgi:hypothetical protein